MVKSCKKCGYKICKNTSSKKTQKNKKNTKKYRLYKVGGGCGCNNDLKPWIGGDAEISGTKIPVYPLNSHEIDPINPNTLISARNLPDIVLVGGKGKKQKKTETKNKTNKKNNKKMKGGDALLGQNPNMPITSFGTTSGAYDFHNIMNFNNSVNPAPYVQPVLNMYGDHNNPLV
jgi:hypothetical protein